MKKIFKKASSSLIFMFAIFLVYSIVATTNVVAKDTVYYMGEGEQQNKDRSYNGSKEIGTRDTHYNWNLGKFCTSGFSGNPQNVDDKLVILKNVGDEIKLSFLLEQDTDKLNNSETTESKADYDSEDNTEAQSEEDDSQDEPWDLFTIVLLVSPLVVVILYILLLVAIRKKKRK